MSLLRNRARIEQTVAEFNGLQRQIDTWLQVRRQKDRFGQYKTQLGVLEQVLSDALRRLRQEAANLDANDPSSVVYSECRKQDQRAVWLQRVWRYFRVKFDQRDDPLLGPALAAADEVVWSCYRPVFQRAALANPAIGQGPVPLAYFELLYSPQAIPKDDPPGDLESNIDVEFLKSFLGRLPIPIVSLPPYCIQAPWWLIYLGHETAHHIQFDLLPNWQLVIDFQNLLKTTVQTQVTGDLADKVADRWGKWGKEIFADLTSVCLMGPWAAWAMNELELQEKSGMLLRKSLYPAPAIRLAMLKEAVFQMQIDAGGLLEMLDPASTVPAEPVMLLSRNLRQEALADLALVPAIVKAAQSTPLGGLNTLPALCGWRAENFQYAGSVDAWRDGLLGRRTIIPEKSLQAPRLISSAGVAAWVEVTSIEDEGERSAKLDKLAEELPQIIRENREEGTRSAELSGSESGRDYGNQLANWLLQTNPDELRP